MAEAEAGIQACLFLDLFFPQPSAALLKAKDSTGSRMTNCSEFSRKQEFLECGTFSATLEKVLTKPRLVGHFICGCAFMDTR